jgi:hypothetical protein
MSPLIIASTCLALMFGATLLGMALRTRLPEHHLSDESQKAVALGTALIATLTALVLGLLIASAKANYDTLNNDLKLLSAKVMELDSTLADYGPESKEARDLLRSAITSMIQRIWPEKTDTVAIAEARHPSRALRALQNKIIQLSPQNDAQRYLRTRALQMNADIGDTRWLFVEQAGKTSLPLLAPLLIVFWLTFLFLSFGLFSPRNAVVITVFAICALSAAGSLLLILELDQPYEGIIMISSEPLRQALSYLGQ